MRGGGATELVKFRKRIGQDGVDTSLGIGMGQVEIQNTGLCFTLEMNLKSCFSGATIYKSMLLRVELSQNHEIEFYEKN